MDLKQLEQKVLSAGRHLPVDESVPYSFEKRVMAQIRGARSVDAWVLWSKPMWISAILCLLLSFFLSAWSMFTPREVQSVSLESTLLSMAEELSDTW